MAEWANKMVKEEYQIQLFKLATKKNMILFHPTESHKLIPILLIKFFCNIDSEKIYWPISKGGVRSFFLVNTVSQVSQKASQIVSQTTLAVGEYSGEMGVDNWDKYRWNDQFKCNQVLVMTVQIFVDLIKKDILNPDSVNLVIFDECHRAILKHPMKQAVEYLRDKQTRLFGLTATVLNGNTKTVSVAKETRELESTFLATISFDEEIIKCNIPQELTVTCGDDANFDNVLENLKLEINEKICTTIKLSGPKKSKKILECKKKILKFIDEVNNCMNSMGLYSGYLMVKNQLEQRWPNIVQALGPTYSHLHSVLVGLHYKLENTLAESKLSEIQKITFFSTDKVNRLLHILKHKVQLSDSVTVFVERKLSTEILCRLVNLASTIDPQLAHIKCKFVVGYSMGDPSKDIGKVGPQRNQNTKILNSFYKREINVLFESNVVEEGANMPTCKYVIMFDVVPDFRAYIQSKVRAQSVNSTILHMNSKSINNKIQIDQTIASFKETYSSLIETLKEGKSSAAPLQEVDPALVMGTLQNTVEDAKRSAALEACKALHKDGDLNNSDLLPVSVDVIVKKSNFTPNIDENEVFEEVVDEKTVHVGTKRNKRTNEKKWADTLTGCAPKPNKDIYLHLIEVTPKYTPPMDSNRLLMVHRFLSLPNQFAILSSKKLPKLAPFPLYLSVGELEARIQEGEKVKLNAEELKQISGFHWTIFDSVLKLAKQFMIRDLSNSQNTYFIAPVVKDKTVRIDWDCIRESNRTFPSPNNKPTTEDRQRIPVTSKNYFGSIITPSYQTVTAQKYIVTKVCNNMSEETQYPTESYANYKEYFKEKYNVEPLIKGQPLLEVRAICSELNNIKPRASRKHSNHKNKEEVELFLLPEFCIVYPLSGKYWLKAQLLPSLLHRLSQLCLAEELRCTIAQKAGIGDIYYSSEWLELKEDVSLQVPGSKPHQDKPQARKIRTFSNNQNITVSNICRYEEEPHDNIRFLESATLFGIFTYGSFYELEVWNPYPMAVDRKGCAGPQQIEVMQALTADVANDLFNCERLKTLGNSFLNFVISVTLFETQSDVQEGYLTGIKEGIVGKKNLYFCGVQKALGPLLSVHEFSPDENWVSPGFRVRDLLQSEVNVEMPDNEKKHGADKNISNAVEAILGVYLKSCGILKAIDLMNWFGVTDSDLLTQEVLISNAKSAARISGNPDPNIHLQQPGDLEKILNYKFHDRYFLLQALTHPSFTCNNITTCYQRLKFLGSAVMDFLITVHIYEKCSTLSPADLQDLRSSLMNNVIVACISVRNHFHKFILYHSPALYKSIVHFVENQDDKNHVIDRDTWFLLAEDEVNTAEAVNVPKVLSDVFEALIGAIYLDSGKDLCVTWTIVYKLMREEIKNFSKEIPKNHVRMLRELGYSPEYKSYFENQGIVLVTVDILHNGLSKQFKGYGNNKHLAKRAAAKHALCGIELTDNLK